MLKAKLTKFGNSEGIVLPKIIRSKLKISKGGFIYFMLTPNGVEITPDKSEYCKQIDFAESIMKKDRVVLRRLAD